jgi:hypothetical protein
MPIDKILVLASCVFMLMLVSVLCYEKVREVNNTYAPNTLGACIP